MSVGENILQLRKQQGLSQEALAEKMLVSRQTVSLWETDQTQPTLDNLMRLKDIFGVSVDYLLSSHDSWEKPESFKKAERNFHSKVITVLVIFGIWTLAFLIYIIGWLLEANWWLLFIYAVPDIAEKELCFTGKLVAGIK